mgnify:CR=1 FL=1
MCSGDRVLACQLDHFKWYDWEALGLPQVKGAEITERNFSRARYDGNYRITANFLNWVIEKYDKDLAVKLNAAARQGQALLQARRRGRVGERAILRARQPRFVFASSIAVYGPPAWGGALHVDDHGKPASCQARIADSIASIAPRSFPEPVIAPLSA